MKRPRVIVIGGGGTGCAVALDLAQRGFQVDLIEMGELTSGTTGRHHGQLHSGARYAWGDRAIGRACYEESVILRRIAAESIEFNCGLFVAVTDEEADHLPMFMAACAESGIPCREVDDPRAMEPALSPETRAAVLIPDGTIDAYRLAMQFAATGQRHGARFHRFVEAIGLRPVAGGGIVVTARDHLGRRLVEFTGDAVVNAAGPWAGRVAALAGLHLDVTPTAGTMVAVRGRLTNMVVSRLAPPGDGDILVPQRRLSIIGTTSWLETDPGRSAPRVEDVATMVARGAELVPAYASAPIHAAWTACRPLYGKSDESGRELSREFLCLDHTEDGFPGMFCVIGGKATTLRAMAEVTADTVCERFGIRSPCRTKDAPLASHREFFV